MQEFQSIPGLAGRLFGGAAGASDHRRAQAHGHAQQGPGARCGGVSPAAPPEAVKCPRCESTNTKFCYYNNYNLSQPRHFCKSCRRYWTKGGVLRNVPVGGGCRKTKRASSSSSSSSASSAATSAPSTPTSGSGGDAAAANKNPRRASASSPGSNSNSGSASPTAAVATTPMPTATATPTTPATPSSNSSVAASFTTSSHHHHSNPFSTIDVQVAPPAPIFADQAAALASLFAPPPPPPLPVFTFAAQPKVEAPTTPSELELQLVAGHDSSAAAAPCSSSMVVSEDMAPFASLDDAAGIFDLGDAASAAAYWNAGSCWTDVQDPSMYLP